MKTVVIFGLPLLLVILAAFFWGGPKPRPPLPLPVTPSAVPTDQRTLLEKAQASINDAANEQWKFGKPASAYTASEKAALAEAFQRRLKPAVQKWCQAYGNRAPFRPGDFKLEQFHSTMGPGGAAAILTFMVNSNTTLALFDSTNAAWVFYMAVAKELRAMNSLPAAGTVPITTAPITKADVLRMVQADTGNVFQSSDVTIVPSGLSGALNGGAMVDVGGLKADGFLHMTGTNMHLVFGADGSLVSYGGATDPPGNVDSLNHRTHW